MKRERLLLGGSLSVESGRDINGRFWIALARGASLLFRDPVLMLDWLQLPADSPQGVLLAGWLQGLQDHDAPAAADGLSADHVATGFGPECHALDESDPNHNTRTVI